MNLIIKLNRVVVILALLLITFAISPSTVSAAGTLVWVPVGGQYAATENTASVSMTKDSSGTPYIAYVYYDMGYKWMVKKFNGFNWTQVGPTRSAAFFPAELVLKLAPDNTPYVAFNVSTSSYKASVEKFDGTSWVNVGSPDFSAGTAEYMSFAVDSAGVPYVAYKDDANGNKLTVMKYDGAAWVTVGSAGFSQDTVYGTSIAIDSTDTPYVAYNNGGGGKGYVMKYDGSTWAQVGSTLTANVLYSPSITIDSNDKIYLTYSVYDYFYDKRQFLTVPFIMSYSSTDIDWVAVGDLSSSLNAAYAKYITTDSSNIPYLLCKDSNNKLTVMKYDTSWEYVGNQGFSTTSSPYMGIVTDSSDDPYVIYQDDNGNKGAVYTTTPGYNLNYTAGSNGSISGNSLQAVAAGGTGTAVTPVPNTGYHFVNWSDGSTANPRTDSNMASDLSVTANFAINTYSLSYTAGSNGTLTGTTAQTVNYGDSGTQVTATTNIGYHFVNWSDGSTANPRTDSNVANDIDVNATFSPNIYTITYGLNGGTNDAGNTAAYTYGVGLTLSAPAKSGYTFTGWYEQSDFSGSAVTAISVTDTGNKNFYAKWTANTDGGGGGNGSGSGTSAPTTRVVTKDGTTTATTTVIATIDNSGTAAVTINASEINDAVSQSAHRGGEKTEVAIKVEAPANATTVQTILPAAAVSAVSAGQNAALTVDTPIAAISFDHGALSTISGESSGDVKITAAKVEVSALSPEAQQTVGDRPVYNFSVAGGGQTISQFNGNVTVTIPYTPKTGEDQEAIVIYYINAKGQPEIVQNSKYDPATGTVTFKTTHFSQYAVGYNKVNFSDVSGEAWYSNAVNYAAARGMTTGLGSGKYGPEVKLKRGEFLVMMMRAYGVSPDANPADNFADAGSTYYTGYLAAAKRLGISSGVGNNMYAPGKEITRQEMFTLLYNALKTIGELPDGDSGKNLSGFSDAGQVASWAKDSFMLFTKTGIIGGSGNKLTPEDTTTRAQIAQVLYNLFAK